MSRDGTAEDPNVRRLSRRSILGSTALAGATAAATSFAIQPQAKAQVGAPLDWIDPVLSHGAVNDGSVDASAPINAAIAAAQGLGGPDSGGMVHLQRGVFLIAQTLDVGPGITLAGAGSGTVLRAAPALVGPVVRIPAGSEHAVLADVRIDASLQEDPAGVGVLVDAGASGSRGAGPDTFVLVERVTITGTPASGVVVGQDTREARLNHVVVAGAARLSAASAFEVRGSDGNYTNCVASGTGYTPAATPRFRPDSHGFAIGSAEGGGGNSRVIGCKAFYSGGSGFKVRARRVTVSACQSQDNNGNGFDLDGTTTSVFSGLTSDSDAQVGVLVRAGCSDLICNGLMVLWRNPRGIPAIDRPINGIMVEAGTERLIIEGVVRDSVQGRVVRAAGTNPDGIWQTIPAPQDV